MDGRPNKRICLILTILIVSVLLTEQACGKYGGGSGTAGGDIVNLNLTQLLPLPMLK